MLEGVVAGEIPKKKFFDQSRAIWKDVEQEKEVLSETKSTEDELAGVPPASVQEGEQYYSTHLKKMVTVKTFDPRKGEALVTTGALNLRFPLEFLRAAKSGTKTAKPQADTPVNIIREHEVSSTDIDCRGMRLDEFKGVCERAINDILSRALPWALIIHGHGDGILRKWLRNELKHYPDLKWDSPESSQDGATRIICS